jgi:hypothetical protein
VFDRQNSIRPVEEDDAKSGFFKRRREELPDDPGRLKQRFYIEEKRGRRLYYEDHKGKSLAFAADTSSIKTKREDAETIRSMLDLAASRGWSKIQVSGSKEFMREAWIQASVRGIQARGYQATALDKQEAAKRSAGSQTSAPKAATAAERQKNVTAWNEVANVGKKAKTEDAHQAAPKSDQAQAATA